MSTPTTQTNTLPSKEILTSTYDPVCLILEDLYGGVENTILSDIYERRRWYISPWKTDECKGIKLRDKAVDSPDAHRTVFIEWGKGAEDGKLYLENPEELELEINLKEYFLFLEAETHTPDTIETASRKFTSFTNKKVYTWRYHPPENLEMQWECIDSEGEMIAYWSLKLPFEPEYYSTGCSLTICQGFEDLTLELVTTCMILRTIQKRYHDAAEARRALEPPTQGLSKTMVEVGASSAGGAASSYQWDSDSDETPLSSSDESERSAPSYGSNPLVG